MAAAVPLLLHCHQLIGAPVLGLCEFTTAVLLPQLLHHHGGFGVSLTLLL